ncbi:hypothetical protein BSK59_13020 [Paenibacillus odorifer]|nr:hypothetical protein BSK59_13020 [Paenibacillus odorifer]
MSKLIKARTIISPELECPTDKRGNYELNEYVISVDVARSASENNNKSAIVVLKLIRNANGAIRQVHVVNVLTPPNGLNFKEQSIIVKRIFYQYGGNTDLSKSRVKAVVIDANVIGQGLVDRLLEDVTDDETNKELGCWATINTLQKPSVPNSPEILYCLKSQGINGDIIREFINYVESNKLKLLKSFDDIKDKLPKHADEIAIEQACAQMQFLIDEVSNLKLKKTQNSITVEQVVKRVDKDRFSAISYGLYYINLFLDRQEIDEYEDDDDLVYF